ncbi:MULTISPECIES: hypothetical protein [unclassified Streptomyces]|uniref:hypothetical protein n=1 Tax=unclassified Streptomyces TaxID=2593676 RepID=UPI003BB78154
MNPTATHLRTIALHWTDLRDALATTGITSWPPAGRMSDYLNALDHADEQLAEAARWQAAYARQFLDRDPNQIGATRPPLRLTIVDTMRAVEAALTACADDIARTVQRPPMAMPTARRATYASQREADIAKRDRDRQAVLARADLADPRRWRHTGRRSAPHAALWLLARIEFKPGPCRRLTDDEARRIAVVAAGAAERVEKALDIAAQRATLAQACTCGGQIDMHGGEGRAPVAHCNGCGRIWSESGLAAA